MTDIDSSRTVEMLDRLLRRFVMLESSHPRTWDDFYHFIALAHSRRIGWGYREVWRRLRDYGLADRKAQMYSEIYWHSRCVLQVSRHISKQYVYAKWLRSSDSRLT